MSDKLKRVIAIAWLVLIGVAWVVLLPKAHPLLTIEAMSGAETNFRPAFWQWAVTFFSGIAAVLALGWSVGAAIGAVGKEAE